MIEFFSRAPDTLSPFIGGHLTPIPIDEEISSLSAILMNEDYYSLILKEKREEDGICFASAECLIPLKARA